MSYRGLCKAKRTLPGTRFGPEQSSIHRIDIEASAPQRTGSQVQQRVFPERLETWIRGKETIRRKGVKEILIGGEAYEDVGSVGRGEKRLQKKT